MVRAMVLAAGVGSRLEPISSFLPKPLVPVLNRPVMEHILKLLQKHGITDVISNTHHMADILQQHFRDHPPEGLNLQLFKEEELTGDAGGVRAAKDFLAGDTFIVIMGDLITNADLSALLKEHREKKAIATIAVKQMKDVTRFGVMKRDPEGFITAFQEKPAAHEAISNEISTGIYILEPEVFNHIPETGVVGFGRQIFPDLVKKKLKVLGATLVGHWSDIGTLQDLFRTNIDALYKKIPMESPQQASGSDLLASMDQKAASNVRIGQHVLLGKNISIGNSTVIGDGTIIGDNSTIGANCQLKDCLIFSDSHISDNSKIEDSIIAFNHQIKTSSVAH